MDNFKYVYNKYLVGTFNEDEYYPFPLFCDYFTISPYHQYHHLEYNDDYLLVYCNLPISNVKFIEMLIIDKSKRNKGLGTKYFQEFLDKNNNPKIALEIDNPNAERFWKKFGIIPVPNYKYVQPVLYDGGNEVTNLKFSTNFKVDDIDKLVNEWFKYGFDIR